MRDRASRTPLIGIAAALLAALLAVSCGSAMQPTAATTSSSGGTGSNKDATLSLNKTNIDFGSVQEGQSKSGSLVLTNSSASGGPSVTFSQVATSGTGFSATTAALPIVLAAGTSSTITLTFAPKAAGQATGTLAITVDGASNPANVPLSGDGLAPSQLGVSPGTLNFGTVAIGSSSNKTGTLTAG